MGGYKVGVEEGYDVQVCKYHTEGKMRMNSSAVALSCMSSYLRFRSRFRSFLKKQRWCKEQFVCRATRASARGKPITNNVKFTGVMRDNRNKESLQGRAFVLHAAWLRLRFNLGLQS